MSIYLSENSRAYLSELLAEHIISMLPPVQIKKDGQWLWVRTSNGVRYEYRTAAEAATRMEMCYPDQVREQRLGEHLKVRVAKIPEEP